VRLLFDHNLSWRLVELLADIFPESKHVRDFGLERASDTEIWSCARTHGFTITSKDSDFHQRCLVEATPPKVVWIRRGNCSTSDVEQLLRHAKHAISAFLRDPETAFFVIQ
jgi:predicted nuclease of predicted toxin-antitoxin system